MSTYRERREAKADRLEEWAAKREAKQSSLDEAARCDEAATGIPFGQPILVGHHSERRHRNAIARLDRAMQTSVENFDKAREMSSRADGIRAATANAIYSDDPDAIEALEAKIVKLEAKRAAIKARPHEGWELSNLGATIRNARKRIEQLQRAAVIVEAGGRGAGRPMQSRYPGTCPECGEGFERGASIVYYRLTKEAVCAGCVS